MRCHHKICTKFVRAVVLGERGDKQAAVHREYAGCPLCVTCLIIPVRIIFKSCHSTPVQIPVLEMEENCFMES